MNKRNTFPWFGILLIIIGLLFLIERVGLWPFNDFSFVEMFMMYWPMIFVLIGLVKLFESKFKGAIFFIIIGAAFEYGIITGRSSWDIFWPVIIILIGWAFISKSNTKTIGGSSDISSDNQIRESVTFWGSEKRINSDNFKGGTIDVTFGGIELDLTDAKISKEGAKIIVNSNFGGVVIKIPKNVRIISEGSVMFGAWENKFRDSGKKTPVLTITGSVKFGGIEVK